MRFDIDRLRRFYDSPLGRMAGEMVSARMLALWPHAKGLDMLGVGFADPFLEAYRPAARRTVSASPAEQGVQKWPADGPNLALLADAERLPFRDAMFDRVIVAHALEEADSPARLLRELWRVTAPEARLLIVAAHRRGLWARAESTPFGHGRPFTRGQLYELLGDGMFQPTASARALYAPPIDWRVITSAGEAWENAGSVAWSGFGGVLMVEAVKRVVAGPGHRAPASRVRRTASSGAQTSRAGYDAGKTQASEQKDLRKVCK